MVIFAFGSSGNGRKAFRTEGPRDRTERGEFWEKGDRAEIEANHRIIRVHLHEPGFEPRAFCMLGKY